MPTRRWGAFGGSVAPGGAGQLWVGAGTPAYAGVYEPVAATRLMVVLIVGSADPTYDLDCRDWGPDLPVEVKRVSGEEQVEQCRLYGDLAWL